MEVTYQYDKGICLNSNQMRFNTSWPQCSAKETPTNDKGSVLQAGAKSAVVISLASVATDALTKTPTSAGAVTHLFEGQCVSATVRTAINRYTDQSAVRAISHAGVQGLRNAYLNPTWTSILNGAIDGAGYSVVSDIADSLNDSDGRKSASSCAVDVAGGYLMEMAEALVACRVFEELCPALKLKAVISATLIGGYNVYSYLTQA